MLLRSQIDQDLPLPGLPRLEHREVRSDRDLDEVFGLGPTRNGLADLVLREEPSAPLRDERGEVPFALERDPGSFTPPLHYAMQVLANSRPSYQPNRADRMLPLEFLRHLLRPLGRRSPWQNHLRRLSHAVLVLDLDALLDDVGVRLESERLPNLEPEP